MKQPHTLIRRALPVLLASGLFGAVAPGHAAPPGLCYNPVSHVMEACPAAAVPAPIVEEVVKNVTQQIINQTQTPSYNPGAYSVNSCGNSASYYQSRYDSCMQQGNQTAAYCTTWSGCPSKLK